MSTVTITHRRGALQAGEQPTTRRVELHGVDDDSARGLAALVLQLPPTQPGPGRGTHRVAVAGGNVTVTIEPDHIDDERGRA